MMALYLWEETENGPLMGSMSFFSGTCIAMQVSLLWNLNMSHMCHSHSVGVSSFLFQGERKMRNQRRGWIKSLPLPCPLSFLLQSLKSYIQFFSLHRSLCYSKTAEVYWWLSQMWDCTYYLLGPFVSENTCPLNQFFSKRTFWGLMPTFGSHAPWEWCLSSECSGFSDTGERYAVCTSGWEGDGLHTKGSYTKVPEVKTQHHLVVLFLFLQMLLIVLLTSAKIAFAAVVTGSRRTSGARNVCSERRYSPLFSLLLPFALFSSMASATVTYSGLSKFILSPFKCFYRTFVCGKEDSNMYCKKRLQLSHWLKTLPKHSLSQMHL